MPEVIDHTHRTTHSLLELMRMNEPQPLPSCLVHPRKCTSSFAPQLLSDVKSSPEIKDLFPHTHTCEPVSIHTGSECLRSTPLRLGVVLSGGQAPGGHNVIAGLFDFLQGYSGPDAVLIGFLDGPRGVYEGNYTIITTEMLRHFRNSGGFDMIGSGRHKIQSLEHLTAAARVCTELRLDGLVVIGGDDSNTNAAILAEFFQANHCATKVCGAPKTIDGDLKAAPAVPISFGFDTACRTYAELVGNLGRDALSSQKYYHFVRLMGRAASNIALEVALLTRPNVLLVSEEVAEKGLSLTNITQQLVDIIVQRAASGREYGLILLPEGLIEFMPEFNVLIGEINELLAAGTPPELEPVLAELSFASRAVLSYLPPSLQRQLLLDRDPHGNVQVAQIETEKLLAQTVATELSQLKRKGLYSGKFSAQHHSFGYEGRSALPSPFDAAYCQALGHTAGCLLALGHTGLMASVSNLRAPPAEWKCGGLPITSLCVIERRHGAFKPVIKKALVELKGAPFLQWVKMRDTMAAFDLYCSPGPIQFWAAEQEGALELGPTLLLELGGEHACFDPLSLEVAVHQQRMHLKKGRFVHTPLTGKAVESLSGLTKDRAMYKPKLCPVLSKPHVLTNGANTQCLHSQDAPCLRRLFSHTYSAPLAEFSACSEEEATKSDSARIGVVFCGRQAPGGHDVLAGLMDALPAGGTLWGFVGGTLGLFAGESIQITAELLALYRGQGGFELLGRSVDRLGLPEHQLAAAKVCRELKLTGLVLIGGPRTNTDAAYLAEYFAECCSSSSVENVNTVVVGVPVHMGGALQNQFVEACVGFDTAAKTCAQIVGNNATDGASAKKYYYFQRIMGESASHMALEVALRTRPDYVLLAEEATGRGLTLGAIVSEIADLVCARAATGRNYGSVLVPECLLEAIPELRMLIAELDRALLAGGHIPADLTPWSRSLLASLPSYLQQQLLAPRQSDARVQLSQAETERLLAGLVEQELEVRKQKGLFNGSFSAVCGFIGYQARGAAPSNFDVTYAYNLGHTAAALVAGGYSGYLAVLNYVQEDVQQWQPSGVPITAMLRRPDGEGPPKLVSSRVDLKGEAYGLLQASRTSFGAPDQYQNPGPVQFRGPLADAAPVTLSLERRHYLEDVSGLQVALGAITSACRPGCAPELLHLATKSLSALAEMLDLVSARP